MYFFNNLGPEPKRTHKPAVPSLANKDGICFVISILPLSLPTQDVWAPSVFLRSQDPSLVPCVVADHKHMV